MPSPPQQAEGKTQTETSPSELHSVYRPAQAGDYVALTIAAAAPLAGPCVAGAVHDPACDVDHDGDVDIFDVQLAAGHWNRSGTWTGDGDGWSLTGNAGTNAASNFLGTIGGYAGNSSSVDVWGATIVGGGLFNTAAGKVGNCTQMPTLPAAERRL